MTNLCGDCTLCCTLLGVSELAKPINVECSHCKGGCTIYETRPKDCRTYECVWLTWKQQTPLVQDNLRPDKSHVVIDCQEGSMIHAIRVDPKYPNAWKAPHIQQMLFGMAQQGAVLYLVKDGKPHKLKIT